MTVRDILQDADYVRVVRLASMDTYSISHCYIFRNNVKITRHGAERKINVALERGMRVYRHESMEGFVTITLISYTGEEIK